MKKLIFVLAVVAAMSVVACGGTEATQVEQTNDSTAVVADTMCSCTDSVVVDSVVK